MAADDTLELEQRILKAASILAHALEEAARLLGVTDWSDHYPLGGDGDERAGT